jgi:hypothetical protein
VRPHPTDDNPQLMQACGQHSCQLSRVRPRTSCAPIHASTPAPSRRSLSWSIRGEGRYGCRSGYATGTAVRSGGCRCARSCRHADWADGWNHAKQKARHEDGLYVALAADA